MALFKPYKITSDKLEDLTIKEGQIIITTDTKKLYVDVSATERIEITADAEVDLSDYVTTSTLTSTIGEEASARQKQDQLLEQAIDDKLGADDIIAGSNVQVNHDDESGHITISATDTKYSAGTGLGIISNGFYILNGGVGLNQLADDSVSEDKLVDGAVDTAKIADGAVTADKLAEGVIPEIPDVTLASLGVTATAEELNYVDGVTSNIQTQLNNKAATTHNHAASAITSGTFALDRIPTITDAKISSLSASKLTGTIPTANLPSYVDDVVESTTTANFPETGEAGKIYVATSTNKTYRWSGSSYVEISASLALGTTSSTAFRGDYGNTAYTHATAKGSAFSSGLYKITTNSQGHVTAATAVTKNDITALGIPGSDTNTNTTYTLTKSGSTITLTGSDGSKTSVTDADTNTTYSNMSGATSSAAGKAGLVPAPAAGAATRYLRSDGTWAVPPDTNTTYTLSSFGITATAAELNKLDGCTATATQLNYLNTLTGNVQTQLNGKAASSHTHNYAGSSSAGGAATSAAKINGIQLTNQNLNNYNSGVNFYYAGGGNACTNKPSGVDNFGMFVFQTAGGWWTQVLYGSDDDIWTRRYASSSWTSWVKFYSTGNKPTASEIGAAASNHSHSNYLTTSGTAAAATKLATARTFSLTGDVTGSASFNGTANCSIATTLAANSVTANEIASGAVGLSELSSAVGTVAVQSSTPTDSHVKLWIKV